VPSYVLIVQKLEEHTLYVGVENCMEVSAATIEINLRKIMKNTKDFEIHTCIKFYNFRLTF
jgi:hypothetical protein